MKKMIKIESGSFAALVRSYKKSLNMLAVLQHICQEMTWRFPCCSMKSAN